MQSNLNAEEALSSIAKKFKSTDRGFLVEQTERLIQLGIVQAESTHSGKSLSHVKICSEMASLPEMNKPANDSPLHPHPRRGRKRAFESAADRQRAYRQRGNHSNHVQGVTK